VATNTTEALERWVGDRYRSLHRTLTYGPSCRIAGVWSDESRPTVAAELVAWVRNTDSTPDLTLGRALTDSIARRELLAAFCEYRAQADADALPCDHFQE
jgi:hypothetical protein